MTEQDMRFMKLALEQAKLSRPEDNQVHPLVGAVVVKDDQVLAKAFRGEIELGNHAEFNALEKKLQDDSLAGVTIYTTLEPCTTRNHPKIPCAERLIERKVSRVVIGMLDPNQTITGKGVRRLREANISTDFFPSELMAEAEDMNRDFARFKKDENAERTLVTCRRKGIVSIYEDGELGTVLGKSHVASSQTVRIMQTSGIGLTKQLQPELIAALEHSNTKIHVLIAHADGDFIKEVELMEGLSRVGNIVPEIRSVEGVLKECVDEARDKFNGQGIGKIYLGHYNTHFRTSLLICDDQWCWMTLILPPKRAPLSVSFELGQSSSPLINDCIRHFDRVWDLVEKREIT